MEGIQLFDLTGKIALVPGATHGLGMAMAAALGKAGATVVVNGRNAEKLNHALDEYAAMGLTVKGYVADVTNEAQATALVKKINDEIGLIDILVNNAGIIKRIPAQDMSISPDRSSCRKPYSKECGNSAAEKSSTSAP